jgi:hypothetical protein
VVGVLVLFESEGLAVERAVDVGELALETVALVVVLAPSRGLGESHAGPCGEGHGTSARWQVA